MKDAAISRVLSSCGACFGTVRSVRSFRFLRAGKMLAQRTVDRFNSEQQCRRRSFTSNRFLDESSGRIPNALAERLVSGHFAGSKPIFECLAAHSRGSVSPTARGEVRGVLRNRHSPGR